MGLAVLRIGEVVTRVRVTQRTGSINFGEVQLPAGYADLDFILQNGKQLLGPHQVTLKRR